MSVSGQLQIALDRLKCLTKSAEDRLAKMPGASLDRTFVDVCDSFHAHARQIPQDNTSSEVAELRFVNGRISVELTPGQGSLDKITNDVCGKTHFHVKTLDTFPVLLRLELARHIPELIRLAAEMEDVVVEDVNHVSDDIEHSLANIQMVGSASL